MYKKKNLRISVARAGNVIGGGDWSKDRLIPDCIRSINSKKKLLIRFPKSTRPWQYVLEPLYGYTLLAKKKFFENKKQKFDSWNFAPNYKDSISVINLVKLFQKSKSNKEKIRISLKKGKQLEKETSILKLSASKSKKNLNWRLKFSLQETIDKILAWNDMVKSETVFKVSLKFVKDYINKN